MFGWIGFWFIHISDNQGHWPNLFSTKGRGEGANTAGRYGGGHLGVYPAVLLLLELLGHLGEVKARLALAEQSVL